jgi:hypothetical protein
MADVRTVNVIEDVGSEELARLRRSYNALLDQYGNLLDALATATTVGDVNTAATAALAELETDQATIIKVGVTTEMPHRPQRAPHS